MAEGFPYRFVVAARAAAWWTAGCLGVCWCLAEPSSKRPLAEPRGISASPHPIREKNSDGLPVEIFLRGGPDFHWLEDASGFTVVRAAEKYVYAQIDAEGRIAATPWELGKDNPRSLGLQPKSLPPPEVREKGKRARFPDPKATAATKSVAPTGRAKNIVILMRFSNHVSRTLPSKANFTAIFNSVGGDPTLAPTGSVRDYFLQNSYGAFTLDSTVFGWVTLPKPESHYAAGQSGLSTTIWEAITESLQLADSLIDFGSFDEDADGFVDSLTFIHSGYGAEWGGFDAAGAYYTNRIWSHHWQIPAWTSAEGVQATDYHISPGLWEVSGSRPGRIGVICHEIGHALGLPDLYDPNGGGHGIGSYCLMGNGWGFTGDQLNPPHLSAWAKVSLGWATTTLLPTPGTYSLARSAVSSSVYKIENGFPAGEYLLIENRQPDGFETTLPQGGLAIWHVDEAKADNSEEGFPGQSGWPGNNRHYRVALLQADGRYDLERGNNRGDAGDVYHGGGVFELRPNTTPSTDGYQHGAAIETGNRVVGISASGSTMGFRYEIGPVAPDNDDFVNRIVVAGAAGSVSGSNVAATKEPGEPEHFSEGGRSVWWRWTAPASGQVTVSTFGSSFDTLLGVYTGALVGALDRVASNDDSQGSQSSVTFTAIAGTIYQIAVDGYAGAAGIVQLNWSLTVPTITVAATDGEAAEPNNPGAFTFTRSGPTAFSLTVRYSVGGTASNGTDYLALGGSVNFPAGSSSATVALTPIDDSVSEFSESVTLTVAPRAAYRVGSPASATIALHDNDGDEQLLVDNADGNGRVVFSGVWTAATATPVFWGANYRHDGNRGKGNKSVTFIPSIRNPGLYSVFIWHSAHATRASNVPVDVIHADGVTTNWVNQRLNGSQWNLLGTYRFAEGTAGRVRVRNAATDGYVIADAIQLIPHPAPIVSVAAADSLAGEPQETGLFVFSRTGATDRPLTVNFAATGSAESGVDYEPLGNRVTFGVGSATAAAMVTPLDDLLAEPAEFVHAAVLPGVGYVIGSANSASVTIHDDDSWTPDLVVDNADGPSRVIPVGNWQESDRASGLWEQNYWHDGNSEKGAKSVSFVPTIGVPGRYEVLVWHTAHANRASNVPIDIIHGAGVSTTRLNQRINGSRWNSLGTYDFPSGVSGRVVIRTAGTDGFVIADAVQWRPVPAVTLSGVARSAAPSPNLEVVLKSGGVRLQLAGRDFDLRPFLDGGYVVETSPDLIRWTPVGAVEVHDGVVDLAPPSGDAPYQFYRIVSASPARKSQESPP